MTHGYVVLDWIARLDLRGAAPSRGLSALAISADERPGSPLDSAAAVNTQLALARLIEPARPAC